VPRETEGLDPGEHLLEWTAVSFRGAAVASTQAIFALGSARGRQRAYEAWRVDVEALGFPAAGPEMVLGLTEARLVICRGTFWLGRPRIVDAGIPLERVVEVAVRRHGLVTGLALVLVNGHIVEVEAMRGRPLRRFAAKLQRALVHGSA
jgi:hypothetical protein